MTTASLFRITNVISLLVPRLLGGEAHLRQATDCFELRTGAVCISAAVGPMDGFLNRWWAEIWLKTYCVFDEVWQNII